MCVGKASQKEGDACSSTNRCLAGLYCYSSKCVKECDPKKATPVTNTDCPSGSYCYSSSSTNKGGYCKTFPDNKKTGTGVLGDDCSNYTTTKFCDGSKGFYCNFPKCALVCDPKKGTKTNPDCNGGECKEETTYSYLGGYCIPKPATPTQKVGQECDDLNKVCLAGLKCHKFDTTAKLGKCMAECGTGKPACQAGFECKSSRCLPERKRQRKLGEACEGKDPTKVEWHACGRCAKCVTTGSSGGKTCVQACDPAKKSCAAGEECDAALGICVKVAAQGQPCGTSLGVKCKTGLMCVGTATNGYHCLNTCDPAAAKCAPKYRCVPLSSGGGACALSCSTFADCTYGKVCEDPGSSLGYKICL